MELLVFLFDEFETLDVFGPVEVLGKLEDITNISFVSLHGGTIVSSQHVPVITEKLGSIEQKGEYIILIPGGLGTRKEANNEPLIDSIKHLSQNAKFVLSVCTGSLLLAKSGILDNRKATTNKRVYDWVIQHGPKVHWIKKARWVVDDHIYTSSGVSAGIDMALGFIAENFGEDKAENIAKGIEYIWNKNRENDIFASVY